jgi:tetratricopeptide (TPR) repeat protein
MGVSSSCTTTDHHGRALELARDGRQEQALLRLREHLLDHPFDAEALNDAGVLLHELGRHGEAVEHLRKAVARFAPPAPPEALANLAEAYIAADRAVDSLGILERLRVAGALQVDLANRAAGAMLNAGDAAAAAEAVLCSLKACPDQPPLRGVLDELRHIQYRDLMELGDSYASLEQADFAGDCYREAAVLEPHRSQPHVGLGILALQAGRYAEARDSFAAAAARDARCSEAYGGLAMVYQQRQDFAAALEMYLRCLQLNPDNLVALLGLFQTSCRMGTFAKVIHFLQVYLDRHPGDTPVLFCLATLYARDGRLRHAEKALLDVLALEPGKQEAADMLQAVRADLRGAQR